MSRQTNSTPARRGSSQPERVQQDDPVVMQRKMVSQEILAMRKTVARIFHDDENAVTRFERIALRNYVHSTNPDLVGDRAAAAMLAVDPRSFALACIDALTDGLMPDGKQGAIVPRGRVAVWTPMWRGLVALARRGNSSLGELRASVIYRQEVERGAFDVDLGSGKLLHRPLQLLGIEPEDNDEDIVGAYARATVGGRAEFRILWRKDLLKRRALSGNPRDPKTWSPAWEHWFAQMCCVKAVRALADWLEMPSSYIDAVERYDERERRVRQEAPLDIAEVHRDVVPIKASITDDIKNAAAALDEATGEEAGDDRGA